VDGDICAPDIEERDIIILDPEVRPRPGDFAIINWVSRKTPLLARLVSVPPPEMMRVTPDSRIMPIVEIERLNPPGFARVEVNEIAHLCRVVHVVKGGGAVAGDA
jgi:hypothetical protein